MDETDARRLVEAAAWRTHLHEVDAESSEAFEAWLACDARNASAWRQVQEPWDLFGEQAITPELIEVRQIALARAREIGRQRWQRPQSFAVDIVRPAIAAGILLAVAGSLFFWNGSQADIYQTAAGERRVVTLSDGSQIALDAQSTVKVRYTDRARDLALVTGQARFDVAHDVERPFSVLAGTQKIVATGTAFNVDLIGRQVLVTLIEGRVVVLQNPSRDSDLDSRHSSLPRSGRPNPKGARSANEGIELTAGQQLVVTPTAKPNIATVNLDRATAWQNGQLVFENEPLSTVIARINRYAAHPIDLADDKTSALRISGVFNTGDIDSFVSTLTHYFPGVRAEQAENGSILLTAN